MPCAYMFQQPISVLISVRDLTKEGNLKTENPNELVETEP